MYKESAEVSEDQGGPCTSARENLTHAVTSETNEKNRAAIQKSEIQIPLLFILFKRELRCGTNTKQEGEECEWDGYEGERYPI